MTRDINELHPYVKYLAELLLSKCKEQGMNIIVTGTYRSIQEQDTLFAQGRTAPGNIVTNAKGGQSLHNFRLAFDVCNNVKGMEYDSAVLKKVGAFSQSKNLEWGGSWVGFIDSPHFQWSGGLSLRDLQSGKAPKDPRLLEQPPVPAPVPAPTPIENVTDSNRALDVLIEKGVITVREYWVKAIDVVSYMDLLFINMANAVLLANNTTPGTITDVYEAIQLLAKKDVMNSSDYWTNLLGSIKYIRVLLVNAANRI